MKRLLAVLIAAVGAVPAAAAEPKVQSFQTQKVGDTTYFRVTFVPPTGEAISLPNPQSWWTEPPLLRTLPRLVPQDESARAVYLATRLRSPNAPAEPIPVPPVPAYPGFEFMGVWVGSGPGKFLLIDAKGESPVTLDPAKAKTITVPPAAAKREPTKEVDADDLEGQWAVAQAMRFASLHVQAPEAGFYAFGCLATGRKYKVPVPDLGRGTPASREFLNDQLFNLTTGTAAVVESLQLNRLSGRPERDTGERSVDVTKIPGIDIAEHPWEKLLAGNKPADEPLAKMVPHDQYYLAFRNVRAMIDLGDLFDLWGTAVSHGTGDARDYNVKQRYEKQLCVKSTVIGKALGPTIIKSAAMTGGDPYWREGSDVTVILQAANKAILLAALAPFIEEARQEFGDRLKQGKETYQGVEIETFRTPLREVSLNRASVGDFLIFSNSPAALRRVLDATAGRLKPLADSDDFRYMRTVFRADDASEAGFAFLSDAFIRQLVGPAAKIKEKRRLEAMAGLLTLGHAALFAAWEKGQFPADTAAVLRAAPVKPDDLAVPDGQLPAWDTARQVAFNDVYNTPDFLTPLVELKIDKVTRDEELAYRQFRDRYLGLWRNYFDPIGVRFALDGKRVTADVYVLPLIQVSQYRDLRANTGNGTTKLDPRDIPANAIANYLVHIAPDAPLRNELVNLHKSFLPRGKGVSWLGEWGMVRFLDDPVYAQLAELALREMEPGAKQSETSEWLKLAFKVPVVVGIEVTNGLTFGATLAAAKALVMTAAPDAIVWEPMEPYKKVTIVKIEATKEAMRDWFRDDPAKTVLPAVYYAQFGGAFYASLREEALKEMIDRFAAKRDGEAPKADKSATIDVNASLLVAPGVLTTARPVLAKYLERQSRESALANLPDVYLLYHAGLLPKDATPEQFRAAALRHLGYVPTDPDGSPYVFDPRTDEAASVRHGTHRKPTAQAAPAKDSPLGRVLEQLMSARADARFREDGLYSTITVERK